MIVLSNLVDGPFVDEAEFKAAVVKSFSLLQPKNGDWFCLETEETVPGMPDTIRVQPGGPCEFIEFKITNKRGKIKFRPSQPLFYRRYGPRGHIISILAWDTRCNRVVFMGWDEVLVFKSLTIQIPDHVPATYGVSDMRGK